ncbi:hypothetical protein BO94DRAFT_474379 [Aspergillus sclerotioniger CBS 115572]|uniref:Thioredoxin-like fold domain-containing protein n=1 Tax=Aspergillus sclerotioniger CBS 115572 TaxID=1450535 RepID=A0A317VMW5_9EURO|nr:hypothetical protein BO94DRAFT_474379 [Aspergillus sclerotioniger CBS 115572]PWY75265.1 hypothetical protein BO94DRAFT_474379 [Aspergillus sclerotioniger CBS 115572]
MSPKITLYRGFPTPGIYTWSPFVTKLEARFRFSDIRYSTEGGSIRAAPRGKIPYIRIEKPTSSGESTTEILSDSTLITRRYIEEGNFDDLNAHLGVKERMLDRGITSLLEDRVYFLQSHEKWIGNYYTMRAHILSSLPYILQVIVGQLIYRKQVSTLHGQGTSRYSDEERKEFKREIWGEINAVLVQARAEMITRQDGDGPFWLLGGDRPSEADATVFGFVVGAVICTACPETQGIVRGFPVVVEYARRIHERYFPEYQVWSDF